MSAPASPGPEVAAAFREHERALWALLYRMTGSAADADDLVQETFARALERPPRRMDEPLRPWLVRVAVNLGRDHLRKRRRRGYKGPWLPSPVDAAAEPPSFDPPAPEGVRPEARYDLVESASYAFLLALEALTPLQRAVLLLRDVLDYSVRETAEALDVSEANAKTTHLRARRAMAAYEGARRPLDELAEPTRRALEAFLARLAAADAPGLEALLAEDVRVVSDGGGEFTAAGKPVLGRAKVAPFYLAIAKGVGGAFRAEARVVNGLPAVVFRLLEPRPRQAPLMVLRCEVDRDGKIAEIHAILASRKLTAIRPPV